MRIRSAAPLAALVVSAACAEVGDLPTAPAPLAVPPPSFTTSALAGMVVINEVHADPSAVADADGEWFEVHNRADTAVDLLGWSIASNNDASHTIASSVPIPSRGFAVLARSGNVSANGGVAEDYAYGSLTLANSSDWLALRDAGGASVDSVSWASAMPAGSARGVTDPDAAHTDAKGSNWHTAAAVFGSGDRGTPGAQNDGRRSPLVVRILDVGQADAVFITNGLSRVLVDGGQGMSRMASLVSEFSLAGSRLDMIVLSHAHLDHHGGLREFFKSTHGTAVAYFFENQDAASGSTVAELRDSVSARAGRGELVLRDTDDPCGTGAAVCTFVLDGGARIHLMKPKTSDSNANNRSAAIKLVGPDSASFTMWMSGDAEHEALEWFDDTAAYDLAPGMDVDVLKANHHGSCNGIDSRFLDLLTPDWVTMGVSSTNGYGHIHTQTKDLLTGRSIPWYRTDENGRITITTPGTVGGGYTITVERGSASMDGDADVTSPQAACSSL